MKRALVFVTFLAMAMAAAVGSSGQVTFHTFPDGAAVYLEVSGEHPTYLGESGHPIPLDASRFQDPRATSGDGAHPWLPQRITFKLAGHADKLVTVDDPKRMFERGAWPADGSVIGLVPDGWRVSLADHLYAWRAAVAGGALLLAAAGVVVGRRASASRKALQRARQLEAYRKRTDDEWIGSVVGRWRLTRRLGSGGMAAVYEAVPDDTLDPAEAVAVKLIHGELARDAEFGARFRREIQLSHRLDHPHIVRVIDWGVEAPMYLSMELVRGRPLRELMTPQGMAPGQVVELVGQILQALRYAHERGIVHRDLKPENVMVTDDGRVKLMDFGLARTHDVDGRLTKTGTALGTPAYMAPEQIAGEVLASCDQYALGVMAWEMLRGEHPFGDGESMTLLLMHMTEEIPSVRSVREDVPEALDRLVSRMAAKTAAQRYPSEEEALRALEGAR